MLLSTHGSATLFENRVGIQLDFQLMDFPWWDLSRLISGGTYNGWPDGYVPVRQLLQAASLG